MCVQSLCKIDNLTHSLGTEMTDLHSSIFAGYKPVSQEYQQVLLMLDHFSNLLNLNFLISLSRYTLCIFTF